mmetsp:Transcript_54812/g.155284  ORF Transcript_54812/g.155284 Transcript_54812/m.155284 type:complete len:254 (+) Transcript_54812:644-1405(+)
MSFRRSRESPCWPTFLRNHASLASSSVVPSDADGGKPVEASRGTAQDKSSLCFSESKASNSGSPLKATSLTIKLSQATSSLSSPPSAPPPPSAARLLWPRRHGRRHCFAGCGRGRGAGAGHRRGDLCSASRRCSRCSAAEDQARPFAAVDAGRPDSGRLPKPADAALAGRHPCRRLSEIGEAPPLHAARLVLLELLVATPILLLWALLVSSADKPQRLPRWMDIQMVVEDADDAGVAEIGSPSSRPKPVRSLG